MGSVDKVGRAAGAIIKICEGAVVHSDVPRAIQQTDGSVVGVCQVQELTVGKFQIPARLQIIRNAINTPIAAQAVKLNAVKFDILTTGDVNDGGGAAGDAHRRAIKIHGLQRKLMKWISNVGKCQSSGAVIAVEEIDIHIVAGKSAFNRIPERRIEIVGGIAG